MKIKKINKPNKAIHTYDFEVRDNHHYIMDNGVISHNTSTSIFMDSCAGVMPTMAGFYTEDNKTGKFSVYGMYLKENPLAYERTQPRMDQVKLAKMIGSLQKFVDTSISAEYIFDLNRKDIDAKSLYDLILAAWKEKTKAIYYIRSIKKGESIDNILDATIVCAGCTG